MLNSLGQMGSGRVLCHILHGSTCRKQVVLLVWIHFVIIGYYTIVSVFTSVTYKLLSTGSGHIDYGNIQSIGHCDLWVYI